MKPKHLAIICGRLNTGDPRTKQTAALANRLAEQGHHVELLAQTAADPDLDERVVLRVSDAASRLQWLGLIRYRRWVTKTLASVKPDHTIALLSTVPAQIMVPLNGLHKTRNSAAMDRPAFLERLGTRLKHLRPTNVIFRLQEMRALASDSIDTVIALSPRIEASLLNTGLPPSVKVQRAHTPIPEPRGDPSAAAQTRDQLSKAWGIQPQTYWIAFAFDRDGVQGIEPMLRAFKPLIEQGTDAVLLLIGPTRYTHLAWIAELGLRDHVKFVGRTARLDELLAASDLIAHPTSYDPAGWGVRIALSAGRPIITTTACDLNQVVQERGGAVLPSPVEPQDLLNAIREHHDQWQNPTQERPEPDPPVTPADPLLLEALVSLLEQLGGEKAAEDGVTGD